MSKTPNTSEVEEQTVNDYFNALFKPGDAEAKKIDQQYEPTLFLLQLTDNAQLLPHLPTTTKREIVKTAKNLFGENPQAISAVKNMLYPEQPHSIIERTFRILFDYLILLVRIVASVVTRNTEPFKELWEKAKKDVVRVIRGVYGLCSFVGLIVYAIFYTPLRALADGLCNGIVARLEGWIRGNRHTVSKFTTEASIKISTTYTTNFGGLLSPIADGVDMACKSVTHPDARNIVFKLLENKQSNPPIPNQSAPPIKHTMNKRHPFLTYPAKAGLSALNRIT